MRINNIVTMNRYDAGWWIPTREAFNGCHISWELFFIS